MKEQARFRQGQTLNGECHKLEATEDLRKLSYPYICLMAGKLESAERTLLPSMVFDLCWPFGSGKRSIVMGVRGLGL